MSFTIRPNIAMSRRYASHANRSFADRARASTVASLRPKFRTVSIIPGIESFAPERTETNSGFAGSPTFRPPPFASTADSPSSTCFHIPGGKRPVRVHALQAFVVSVKPGGTGRPRRVISARPAPLPPRGARIGAVPSSHALACVVTTCPQPAGLPSGADEPCADLCNSVLRVSKILDVEHLEVRVLVQETESPILREAAGHRLDDVPRLEGQDGILSFRVVDGDFARGRVHRNPRPRRFLQAVFRGPFRPDQDPNSLRGNPSVEHLILPRSLAPIRPG